jgi:hypothetical protein
MSHGKQPRIRVNTPESDDFVGFLTRADVAADPAVPPSITPHDALDAAPFATEPCAVFSALQRCTLGGLVVLALGCGGASERPSRTPSETETTSEEQSKKKEEGPTYHEDLDKLCRAEKLSDAPQGAPPRKRMDHAAGWMVEHIENHHVIQFMQKLVQHPPAERVTMLEEEARTASIGDCPLTELITKVAEAKDKRTPDAGMHADGGVPVDAATSTDGGIDVDGGRSSP